MGNLRLYGSTSGYTELAPPAVAPDGVLSLPSGTGTLLTAEGGKILQVQHVFKNDTFSTTSTSYIDVTGLTVSITPTSATSKILVFVDAALSSSSSQYVKAKLLRESTDIATHTAAEYFFFGYHERNISSTDWGNTYSPTGAGHFVYLDEPATTSATAYKIQILASPTTSSRVNVSSNGGYTVSSITLMEVSA